MNKIKLGMSMLIFGTIGIFVKYIPLSSSIIAMTRGYMGAAFLLVIMLLTGKKPDLKAIKNNLLPASGRSRASDKTFQSAHLDVV